MRLLLAFFKGVGGALLNSAGDALSRRRLVDSGFLASVESSLDAVFEGHLGLEFADALREYMAACSEGSVARCALALQRQPLLAVFLRFTAAPTASQLGSAVHALPAQASASAAATLPLLHGLLPKVPLQTLVKLAHLL